LSFSILAVFLKSYGRISNDKKKSLKSELRDFINSGDRYACHLEKIIQQAFPRLSQNACGGGRCRCNRPQPLSSFLSWFMQEKVSSSLHVYYIFTGATNSYVFI
jgi:hypothetical protein